MTDRMTNELLIKRLRRNPLICTDRVDATGAAADRIEEQQKRIRELEAHCDELQRGKDEQFERISELEARVRDYESILYRNGFEPCSVSECNCGSWHQVRGWPLLQRITRMAEQIRELEAKLERVSKLPAHEVALPNGRTGFIVDAAKVKEALADE